MGWLSLLRSSRSTTGTSSDDWQITLARDASKGPSTEHIEYSYSEQEQREQRGPPAAKKSSHFLDKSISNEELPLIKPEEVVAMEQLRSKGSTEGRLWIVIDQVVYDCTEYQFEHPGGADYSAEFQRPVLHMAVLAISQ